MSEAIAIDNGNNNFLNHVRTKRTTCTACPDGCSLLAPMFLSPDCPRRDYCPNMAPDGCHCRCRTGSICLAIPRDRCRLVVGEDDIMIGDNGCDVVCIPKKNQ